MAMLYVLQAGHAEWNGAKRIESVAGAPLSEEETAAVGEIVEELADREIKAVYASQGASEKQTAKIAGGRLKLRWHRREDLRELDYGLWQGLLVDEVQQRYGKLYRQWRQAQDGARPPGGETFAETQTRICQAVAKILKRHRDQNVLLVLRPMAAGLLKCRLGGQGPSDVWESVNWSGTWAGYDLDQVAGVEVEQ
jgi:broad specificity phosphatase PhoE